MFCRNCGTQNSDDAPTCISCGETLTNPYQGTIQSGAVASGDKPKNYLVQSILVTLCCCLPIGIVSIVYAAQVDSKWNAGDRQGAIHASQNANKWSLIAFGLGIVINLIVFGLQLLAGIGAAADQGAGNAF